MHLALELPGKGLVGSREGRHQQVAGAELGADRNRRTDHQPFSAAGQISRPGSEREVSLIALRADRTGDRQATGDDCRGGGASHDSKAGHVASVGHGNSRKRPIAASLRLNWRLIGRSPSQESVSQIPVIVALADFQMRSVDLGR